MQKRGLKMLSHSPDRSKYIPLSPEEYGILIALPRAVYPRADVVANSKSKEL